MFRTAGRVAALALITTLVGNAAAAPRSFAGLSPSQVRHLLKHPGKAGAQVAGQYNLDAKAPTLKAVSLGDAKVTLRGQSQSLMVRLKASDGLTGVAYAQVAVRHRDSGYEAWGNRSLSFPLGQVGLDVAVNLWGDMPSGSYVVSSVLLQDVNGNQRVYDEAALAALGRTDFEVVNRFRNDGQPPEVTSGTVLTPTVSLSSTPKGEYPGSPARLGLSVQVSDTGVSQVSGADYAYITLCDAPRWNCVYLGAESLQKGRAQSAVVLGTTVEPGWLTTGVYTPIELMVRDAQGNYRYYTEWDTDFNALFGADASITIVD